MNYYIADCHFGHRNVINFDHRPYSTIEEMDDDMIKKWNSKVGPNDTVYVLGDFVWVTNENYLKNTVKKLKGKKILIKGNHDRIHSKNVASLFSEIVPYKEISDEGFNLYLSHYFIPLYNKHYYDNNILLYGHSHNTKEADLEEEMKKFILSKGIPHESYNVGACWLNYEPCTLKEIFDLNGRRY